MKLYHSVTSPFARKVEVCLIETGLIDAVEFIAASGTPLAPNDVTIRVNPLGKVPCLVLEDGRSLYDSRVITRYLETLSDVKLYPDSALLWDTLRLEALADGMMEATLAISFENRLRAPDMRSQDWIDGQWSKVARAMAHLQTDWMDHLAGPLDMGQIGIAVACGYVDVRAGDRNWRAAYPVLSAWQVEFAKRDSMCRTAAKA